MLGFPGVTTTRIEDAFARVHRDDLNEARTQFEAGLRGVGGGLIKAEFRFVRPGGEVGWMTWTGRVHFREGPTGPIPFRIDGACVDITERKRQEEHIRLLMRETAHRSKNLLTLAQAVARQTLSANPQDFLERFGKRLEALAASQDLLVKNAWKGADLNELIRSQLAHFDDLIGSRIEVQGPKLYASASAAQALGMALHELATNAGKYGALASAGGRIEITWCLQRDEDDKEMFVIAWREHCANPIAAPCKQGFGSAVIGSMAEMSLGAKVELNFPASGLTWRLQCAAEEIVEGRIASSPSQKMRGGV
jgi:two-component sensor histidine kinase